MRASTIGNAVVICLFAAVLWSRFGAFVAIAWLATIGLLWKAANG